MKIIENEKGLVMPLVLIIMVLMALLGTSIWFMSLTDLKQVERDQKRTQSYYMAAAGADAVGQYITINPDEKDIEALIDAIDGAGSSEKIMVSSGLFGNVGELDIEVKQIEQTDGDETIRLVQLTGKGYVDDVSQQVNLYLEKLTPAAIFNAALKVNNDVDLSSMGVLSGDIVSSGSVDIDSSLLCGNNEDNFQYCNPDYEDFGEEGPFDVYESKPFDYKTKDFDPVSEEEDFEDSITIGNNESLEIITNRIIDEIDVNNNGKLIVDARNRNADLKVEVNTIDMKQNAEIIFHTHQDHEINLYINEEFNANGSFDVEGFGGVNIYIRSNAKFQTPNSNVVENAYLIVYLEKGSEMALHANAVFRGYIYGPEATVKAHSASSTIIGSVVANSFVAHNKDDAMGRLIYEPFVREEEIELNLGYRLSYWTR